MRLTMAIITNQDFKQIIVTKDKQEFDHVVNTLQPREKDQSEKKAISQAAHSLRKAVVRFDS